MNGRLLKPRLSSGRAQPIRADADIWDLVISRCRPMRIETISRGADKRDADLMLEAQQIIAHGPCAIELDGIQVRGWTQERTGEQL